MAQTSLVGPAAVDGKPMLEQAAGMLVMERCLCVLVLIDHARRFARSEYSLLQSTPWEWQLRWGFDCHLKWKSAGSPNSRGGEEGERKRCSRCPGWCSERELRSEKGTPRQLILLLAVPPGSGACEGSGVLIHVPWLQGSGQVCGPHP